MVKSLKQLPQTIVIVMKMNDINFFGDRAINKRSIIFYAVWLLVLVIIQPTAVQWIRIFGVSPDLFLIFVICTGLIRDKREGAVIGFVFGLVLDMMVGRMVGLSAIVYMYLGLLTGLLRDHFVSDGAIVCAITVFIAALIYNIIYYIGYFIAWGDLGFGIALIRIILPKALYTGIAGFILCVPIGKSFNLLERRNMI